ncbi:MAG: sulfide/dihydroorotate dehydrogenase-like FAD/NAD-binding protein [Prevotellaceae bacterium]|jgi:ferredoxin--NADP+ reductase|nr:sulfide/dihydroorotate dehydrogenase-like FAD/NAD-binding protein [Prevotellaceae bacterium]
MSIEKKREGLCAGAAGGEGSRGLIVEKRELAENIYLMRIYAPRIAKAALPGQFVMVRASEWGERIPLTISDYDAAQGTVTLVTQVVGMSSRLICRKAAGEQLTDIAGPLGRPSEFVHRTPEELAGGRWLFVGGGLGTAPVYPQVKWLHAHGASVDVIIGAKSAPLLIFRKEMEGVCKALHIATDDGSAGQKGFVTDVMRRLVDDEQQDYTMVVAIGPMIMMKFVAQLAQAYHIPSVVSLNMLMVDGTGMCGACRVTVGGKTQFTCVDGPEFDGAAVDFDEAMRRQNMYNELNVEH